MANTSEQTTRGPVDPQKVVDGTVVEAEAEDYAEEVDEDVEAEEDVELPVEAADDAEEVVDGGEEVVTEENRRAWNAAFGTSREARHVVLDLETLDTKPTAVVLAIGAYCLDQHGKVMMDSRFHTSVNVALQILNGRTIDKDTVKFWSKQSEDAQAAAFGEDTPVELALGLFSKYMEQMRTGKALWVWGNGTNFDNAILSGLYDTFNIKRPWHYTMDADYRTLRKLWPDLDKLPFEGEKHNAADDALHEARGLELCFTEQRIPLPN